MSIRCCWIKPAPSRWAIGRPRNFFRWKASTETELADAAQLASLSDETPEGRSIVVLAKQYGFRDRHLTHEEAAFVPFTATTRMSGIDLERPAHPQRRRPMPSSTG